MSHILRNHSPLLYAKLSCFATSKLNISYISYIFLSLLCIFIGITIVRSIEPPFHFEIILGLKFWGDLTLKKSLFGLFLHDLLSWQRS